MTRYDRIGIGYTAHRRPDPRIARYIDEALGGAATILNVGAGTGSYEPQDRGVVAVDPSWVMLADHPGRHRVQAVAEALPFPAGAFDAAMATMTVHHWADPSAGLQEVRRAARRQVVFTFDGAVQEQFWLADYFPFVAQDGLEQGDIGAIIESLDAHTVNVVPVPHDCTDGFLTAYWRRPECYLDPEVRKRISTFARRPDEACAEGLARLHADLESGAWDGRYGHLREQEELDVGCRLVIAGH